MTEGAVLLAGSHPRHRMVARRLHDLGCLAGLVIEEREAHIPPLPDGLSQATAALFRRHFDLRAQAETRFFGGDEAQFPTGIPTLRVDMKGLNSVETQEFIRQISPNLLLSYGCHKVSAATRASAPGVRWNIHGGLSPRYRGVTTHFWPSYLLEPQMTGMTVHMMTDELDGGDVVHQCTGPLVRGDGLHDLACRTVSEIVAELPQLVERAASGKALDAPVPQTGPTRLWQVADWAPAHLHLIYEVYEDRIVDRYLDGTLTQLKPVLVRQSCVQRP
jgi:folate-dependent phosphoribosylglycinamide formyltransferase PurN